MDDATCFATVRDMRWPDGVQCPHCDRPEMTKQGHDDMQPERQRYVCKSYKQRFDDVTATLFSGHHPPLRIWILCLSLMGLHLSNAHMAHELALNKDDVQQMTTQLRQGIVHQKPASTFSGEVDCDEVSIVAAHKGQPDEVSKKGASADAVDSRGRGDVAPSKARNHRSSA